MEDGVVFKLEHLDRYAIISKPCTVLIKNNSRVSIDKIFTSDGHPRWILNLKAVSDINLDVLKKLSESGVDLTYKDMGHLLMKGVIWEGQVNNDSELPCKGEELIAVFDYVDGILLCTSITLIPRRQPLLYQHATEAMDEIKEFERIINKMHNEK